LHGCGRVTDVDKTDSDEPVTKRIDLLSPNVISLVDRFCFLAPFNCRMTLEAKVPIDLRRSVYKNVKAIIESDEENDQFRDTWIEHVRANPQDPESGDDEPASKWVLGIYADSDDSEPGEPATKKARHKSRNVNKSSLAATATKDGAGIRDNDILLEGTAPGLQDEDNPGAAAEGIARLATGKGAPKSPAKAAAPKSPAKAAAPVKAGAAADA
jgi:hypothetical protein